MLDLELHNVPHRFFIYKFLPKYYSNQLRLECHQRENHSRHHVLFLSSFPLNISLPLPSWWIGCLMRASISGRSHLWLQPISHQRSMASQQWSSAPVLLTVWSLELCGDVPGTEKMWEATLSAWNLVTSTTECFAFRSSYIILFVFRRYWTACCSTQFLNCLPRSDTLLTKLQEKSGNYFNWF